MKLNNSAAALLVGACAALLASTLVVGAQQAPAAPPAPAAGGGRGGGRGGGGNNSATTLYNAIDTASPRYGCVTRASMKAAFDSWFTQWDSAKTGSLHEKSRSRQVWQRFPRRPPPAAAVAASAADAEPGSPCPRDVDMMMAAIPDKAPAKPLKPRKVLVLATSGGFVHSSIPLAAKTVEAMGTKTGA